MVWLGFGWVAWYCCWVLSIIRSFARLIKWKLFGNESWKSRWDVEWVWYLGKKGAFSVIFRIILYKCCCFPFFRWSKFPRDYVKRLFFFIYISIQHFIHSPVSFYILIVPLETSTSPRTTSSSPHAQLVDIIITQSRTVFRSSGVRVLTYSFCRSWTYEEYHKKKLNNRVFRS